VGLAILVVAAVASLQLAPVQRALGALAAFATMIGASGTATLGGYFPGVDTFLGLQVAAQEIADDLARRGFCRKLGPGRSTGQWLKWARNKQI